MFPSPNDLSYFIAILEAGNVSHAALKLGISQPSLSQAIQRLEACYQAKLFSRSPRGVLLTQAGKKLLPFAKHILEIYGNSRDQLREEGETLQGSLTIGCHPSVAQFTLAPMLPLFIKKYSGIRINFKHGLSREMLALVMNLEADVGIIVNPTRHQDLVIKKICEDEVCIWYHPEKVKLDQAKLGNVPLIANFNLTQTQAILRQLEKKSNLQFPRLMESENLEFITTLVNSGAGMGVLPTRIVKAMRCTGLLPVPNAPTYRDEISLCYHMAQHQSKILKAFSTLLLSSLA
jgi:DNA-binding transcriptional LysR family regulator